ncbi:c-type cytochrome domain-containing protein [Arenibacter sp. GZD96]|uniref:c-type cytochrome domain-containing protein n=1 Tax=Aurantibrevibacter litoralis TaxID=3106030 RepID=UPI002AFE18B6|nr:c-type cytochrome domain-containing protein [Arenibacter sp. GZD-96]MEA1784695.1 c-type cytochrome domain-containing protein [Arenibacter sp. GZD-96]
MEILKQLLGRLHPLLVHLPIGFIILALLFQAYDRTHNQLRKVIATIYLWAGFAAAIACLTGYLQYLGEGYAYETIQWHLWSGIVTALFCFLMWLRLGKIPIKKSFAKVPISAYSVLMFILISFTGHQGGNITHGEDYLVEPLPNSLKAALGYEIFEEKEIVLSEEDWQNAVLYTDIVQPILNNNCVSCHNPKKSKGDLLLHTKEGIETSGENAPVVMANQPDRSELFKRMALPKEDDKHMPPDGKRQPTKEEVALIGAWIKNGMSFDKTIGEIGLEKSLLAAFFPKSTELDHPSSEIVEAHKDSILKVKETGLHVHPISETTNFLKVSALNLPSFEDSDVASLLPVKEQVALLDLGGTQISDAIFSTLSTLPNLTILKLDHTSITGDQIEQLASLQHLKSLNVSHTNFKEGHVPKLQKLRQLKKVFLYNTMADQMGTQTLAGGKTVLEYGKYTLPPITSDSIVY